MKPAQIVYLRDISRRWKIILNETSDRPVIVSPYITPKTGQSVIRSAKNTLILTRFEAEIFATGGSSLKVLKNILMDGKDIYYHNNLHAKCVLTNQVATIGSQNLTAKGTSNLEATYIITNAEEITELKVQLQRWIEQSKRLSLDAIEDMESYVKPITRKYQWFTNEFGEIDSLVDKNETERIQKRLEREAHEKQQKVRKQHLRANRERTIRSNLSGTRDARAVVRARLLHIEGESASGFVDYHTLKIPNQEGGNLTEWDVDGELVELEKSRRYPMVNVETGRMCWPRVNRRQITKLGKNLFATNALNIHGDVFDLGISLYWDEGGIREYNVQFDVRRGKEYPMCSVFALFDMGKLSEVQPGNGFEKEFKSVSSAVPDLASVLQDKLLSDFRYEMNSTGGSVERFLSGLGREFTVRLALVDSYKVLVIERD